MSRRAVLLAGMAAACALRAVAADAPAAPAPAGDGPLRMTLAEAVLAGLEHNRALKVERQNPAVRKTYADEARAAFDPALEGGVSYQDLQAEQLSRMSAGTTNYESTTVSGRAGLAAYLPLGTRLALEASTTLLDSSLYGNPFDTSRVGVTVTQPLLQGGGRPAVLAALRQARLDVLGSRYELRG